MRSAGAVGSWPAATAGEGKVCGRICAVCKSAAAAARARKTARREARRRGSKVKPGTLAFADYVIVFATFDEEAFSARKVLEWYRLRWHVELVFKPSSPWREFRLALNRVRRAIEPALSLARTIDEWNDISKALSESPRRRRLQRDETSRRRRECG